MFKSLQSLVEVCFIGQVLLFKKEEKIHINSEKLYFFPIEMFDKLIKKYKSIKSEYLNRSPRQKWELIRNATIFVHTPLGHTALDPNYKPSWLSLIPMLVPIDVFISFAYTIWIYRDEPMKGFLFTPLISVLVPVNTPNKTKQKTVYISFSYHTIENFISINLYSSR